MIIQNIRTYTPGRIPFVSEILEGQIFINIPDTKIYTKDKNGNIINIGIGNSASLAQLAAATGATLVGTADGGTVQSSLINIYNNYATKASLAPVATLGTYSSLTGIPVPQREVFVAGTDFTPGTSQTITLAGTYGAVTNIQVHFNGVYQSVNQIQSLIGKVLTFSSVIPVGVSRIYVDSFAVSATSTNPPIGSVGVAQLAPDTLNYFLKAPTLASSTGASLVGTSDGGTVQSDINGLQTLITTLQNTIAALTTNASCATTATRPTPTFVGQSCLDMQLGYTVYARQLNPPVWQNAYGVYPV